MKSMDIKRIGTLAASTIMLGAALAGPVSAAMDPAGLTKEFFYDANMKPLVQIVVGSNEKANPMDAVAAGNIAATIGNLAYIATTETVTPGEVEGQVVISTTSMSATGDYIQDTNADDLKAYNYYNNASKETVEWFYDDSSSKGLWFDGSKTYERGDFTIYETACARQTRAEAGILTEGEFKNIYCLFCETLCKEGMEWDVTHEMKESIFVDSSKIRYYEDGIGSYDAESLKMAIDENAIKYTLEAGCIPMQRIKVANVTIDEEYRGEIILFGEKYYVRDIKGTTSTAKIYLSKGEVLEGISSEGYTAEYNGYKFKIDHLIYSAEYVVAGILLDVQKPDGTVMQVQVSRAANGQVDNLIIAGVTAEESAAVATGSIIVYDKTTEVVLEGGKDLELGGEKKKYWKVSFDIAEADTCSSDISEYDDASGKVLKYIYITYTHDLDGVEALEVDESLRFPNNFILTFKGYLDNNAVKSPCSGENEGNIKLERGSDDHQLLMSFTGEDNNRYDNVRLDEGSFMLDELFMVNSEVYKFVKVENENETWKKVTIDPVIAGTRKRIDVYSNVFNDTVKTRFLSLIDALDDATPTRNGKDKDTEMSASSAKENLYVGTFGGLYLIYDDTYGVISFATSITDNKIEVNPSVAMAGSGYFGRFELDDNTLRMSLVREEGIDKSLTYEDELDNSTTNCAYLDQNCDGDDEDVLVKFKNTDNEHWYVDFMDRNYDESLNGYSYDNNVWYDIDASERYNSTVDRKIDKDEDTLLILPKGGDEININWGTDYLIESVDICKPQSQVDATYFIGTEEKESTMNSTITKTDVGKDITAGCCEFHVAEFGVVGTGEGGEVTTEKVTKISLEDLGKLVVSESAADETKNLILVGGPVVNSMVEAAGITADDIAAEPDKFLVKKVDNKVIVAGWEKGETVEAGNALIAWLQENIHA